MPKLTLETDVQFAKGVGPVRAEQLARLGIRTINDLIEHYPFRYDIQPPSQPIGDLEEGEVATVIGQIQRVTPPRSFHKPVVTALVEDGTGRCRVKWFNAPYILDRLNRGDTIRLSGKVTLYRQDLAEFVNPKFRILDDPETALENDAAEVEPVYPAVAGFPSRAIAKIIRTVVPLVQENIEEPLPKWIIQKRNLPPRRTAIARFHLPTKAEDAIIARRRLAYDELLLHQLAVHLRRIRSKQQAAYPIIVTEKIDERIRARFPFTLTEGQEQAIREITADLAQPRPMNRLLQADVGAGKTAVALYAALAAVANNSQAAILAPTEILAEQHYRKCSEYLHDSRVRIVCLVGGQPKKLRNQILEDIRTGQADIIIGTHAVIQSTVQFANLNLAVIDEQHRFGVAQRAALRDKGTTNRPENTAPHCLVLTATPIPRTLALTLFGDLDVSIIKDRPAGRGPLTTTVIPQAEIESVHEFIRQKTKQGQQAYIIYPLVEEPDQPNETRSGRSQANLRSAPRRSLIGRLAPPSRPSSTTNETPPLVSGAKRSDQHPNPPSSNQNAIRSADDHDTKPNVALNAALKAAITEADRLRQGAFAHHQVGLLHGRMTPAEKEQTMNQFRQNEIQILVATTVVEVGIDVPNATVMVIHHARRFGLAQLHQLRGRIGRGPKPATCYLIDDNENDNDNQSTPAEMKNDRLTILAKTNDGFKIAEADLKLRGPGEIIGTRQHGVPLLKIADLIDDLDLLHQANADAKSLLKKDPTLTTPENVDLVKVFRSKYTWEFL